MVVFLVNQRADSQGRERIERAERVKLQRRQMPIQHDDAEVFDSTAGKAEKALR